MAKIRILIVEDNRIIALGTQSILDSLGYAVTSIASSAGQAIKKAEEDNPDLILMDIVLEGEKDGIEAACQIQSRFNIPVVFLTAYSDKKMLERAKAAEPFAYIIKPCEGPQLQSAIEIALYKSRMDKKLKEREEWLSTALKKKEVLLKEIHHQIKNNMQIIYSLLSLQSRHIKDKDVLKMLTETQNRIKSMALIHERLYQSKDLAKIEFGNYIRKLIFGLFRTYGVNPNSIKLKIDVKDVYLDIDKAIPCGLIVNELVSNSLKHAFPESRERGEGADAKKEIYIKFSLGKNNKFTLIISDNGVGIPRDLDFRKTASLGLQLVNILVGQLKASIKLRRKDGTSFTIIFT